MRTYVRICRFSQFPLRIRDINKLKQNVIISELEPSLVQINNKDFKFGAVSTKDAGFTRINIACIRETPPFFIQVKWKFADLNSITIARNYPLALVSDLKHFSHQEMLINRKTNLKEISKRDIRLDKRVKLFDELVEIAPYLRSVGRKRLFKIPIVKKPAYKSYFSFKEMDNFRQILADYNSTKKINVEIHSIFDKFGVELYSSIKQDPNTRDLICFPKLAAAEIRKDDLYYLIIGGRKDNKVVIKALARMEAK